jgi:hypothetical protein
MFVIIIYLDFKITLMIKDLCDKLFNTIYNFLFQNR